MEDVAFICNQDVIIILNFKFGKKKKKILFVATSAHVYQNKAKLPFFYH